MTTVRVAAAQHTPVFMNLDATIEKTCRLIAEAARNGAQLVAFPEAYVPAYPYWVWLYSPLESEAYFERLYHSSVTIPGPHLDHVCATAAEHSITVVLGVNEVSATLTGTIYNTNVIISDRGEILGRHRKLVPTHAEKLVWGNGDGSSYVVYETPCGRFGTLLCGENTNTLARFALLAQGEQVHVANFPAFPFTNWYRETEAIRIRCQAHAFEGKVYVIAATSAFDEATMKAVAETPEAQRALSGTNYALSAIFGPDGQPVSKVLIDEPGIVYGDIDLDRMIRAKQMHDITGHYNQFGVLSLHVNREPALPLTTPPPRRPI